MQVEGGMYFVARSQGQIFLVKWTSSGGGYSALFREDTSVKYENTTVVLQFSAEGNALRITAKLLDKDNANAVLYEQSFLDGPGSDVGVLPNLPPGFAWVSDPGAPLMNVELAWAGVVFIGAGTPTPAELVVDNLEYDLYPAPGLAIEKSVLLSWPENTAEEQSVVSAESLTGPWVPCLEPIFKLHGEVCMAVPTTHNDQWLNPAGYFKLVAGSQFSDDFSGGHEPWVPLFIEGDPNQFAFNRSNGVLRLQGQTGAPASWGFLAPPGPDLVYADVAMSLDILGWDPNAPDQEISFAARGTVDRQNPGTAVGYLGYLVIKETASGGRSRLALYSDPPNTDLRSLVLDLDPQKAYRLLFSAVGTQLTLDLFELGALRHPVALAGSLSAADSRHSHGSTGLWWLHHGQTAFDITVDNCFVSGTKPPP